MTGVELRDELEALVDATDIWHVLHQLGVVCVGRATLTNDLDEAKDWESAGLDIHRCAANRSIARAAEWQRD